MTNPHVPFDELRLDDATWGRGSAPRRLEWRLCLDELLLEGRFDWCAPDEPLVPPRTGLIVVGQEAVRIELKWPMGGPLPLGELAAKELHPLASEYMQICRDMSRLGVGSASPRLEALDIAKRITHDEAGEVIVRQLQLLKPDHGTARRLFTLLVTLLFDTTVLAAPPHALHR
jgi:hypothetical protein